MYSFLIHILILGIISVSAELQLQIVKNYNEFYIPVTDVVEEKVGTSFSLLCELIVNNDTNNSIDDHLTWVKGENLSNQTSLNKIINSIRDINKSEKRFSPLLAEDKGNYYCISHKFNLSKNITILVIDNVKKNDFRPMRETIFCNDQMFQCVSNGLCIIPHYVCDGKPDCKDESDESFEQCNGDPCRDKIPCEDGRCIPSVWCCDRQHDLNCTVTNRPKCCQSIISEAYEELEYPTMSHSQQNGARYLFISVCSSDERRESNELSIIQKLKGI
nr:low-density lipoprotein receptor-related protein 1B-like isoform X2 [Leptinotarsa decemlineata]